MNFIKKYSWSLVPLIAFGGLFYPLLGLLVLVIMFVLMAIGITNGRYWCGNICPHGSLFDNIINKISLSKNIPDILKSQYLKWGFFFFFMGMFLFRIIRVINYWGTEEFLNNLGFLFVLQYLIMPTILGAALSYLISPRAWCTFCPMGTMAEIMYKIGKITGINKFNQKISITSQEECKECGACARACPLELNPYQNFNENNAFDNEQCMKCGECAANCPLNLLELKNSRQKTEEKIKISS